MIEWLKLVVGVMMAEVAYNAIHWAIMYFVNRDKPNCELCHKVRITRKTKDKKYWACRGCRGAYYKENGL